MLSDQATSVLSKMDEDSRLRFLEQYDAVAEVDDEAGRLQRLQLLEQLESVTNPTVDQRMDEMVVTAGDATDEIGTQLKGVAEVGTTIATSIPAQTVGGLAGVGSSLLGADPQEAQDVTEYWVNKMTYIPRSEAGQKMLHNISAPFKYVEEELADISEMSAELLAKGTNALGITKDKPFDPAIATAIKTTIEGFFSLIGAKKPRIPQDGKRLSPAEYKEATKALNNAADEMGVKISDFELKQKLVDSAEGKNIEFMGEKLSEFRKELLGRAAVAAREKNAKYEQLYKSPASLRPQSLKEYKLDVESQLASYAPGLIKHSAGMFDQLRHMVKFIDDNPGVSKLKLNAMKQFRDQLNSIANNKATRGSPDNAAAGMMRRKLDKWIDDQFDKGLIQGDPNAVQLLKEATELNKIYKSRFYDDKLIRKMIETGDMTPQGVKKTLFNLNAVGAPAEATATVKRLKQIFGEDGAELANLRSEVLFDLAKPLIDGNLKGFMANYKKTRRNQDSLLREIIPDSIEHYDNLAKLVEGASKVLPGGSAAEVSAMKVAGQSLTRGIAVFMAGHELAKKAYKVSLIRHLLGPIISSGIKGQRKALYKAALGIPDRQSLVPSNTIKMGAIYSGIMERELEKEFNLGK